ncbi:PREDICTED: protein PF14_0175-like [Polistes canadensis]|uniref:protein PF14_0175-like n=1 Tax=Polistes canadensis TaxID=91411 RepID=UPI0007190159|nr:PREDICTED: protein PF14_0175-like [Polistes canadensis]
MKGRKKNSNEKVYSEKNNQEKNIIKKHAVKLKRFGVMSMKYYKNIRNINNSKKVNTDSSNIKRSLISPCKTVFVVIEDLSPKTLEKYITKNKNQSTYEISKTENIQLQKLEQSSISEKLSSKEIQSNDNVSYIFAKNSDVDKTSLNLTNNINVNDKSNKKRKNDDRREDKMEDKEGICEPKVKRRCIVPIEPINNNNQRRKRTSKSSVKDIEQITVLNNLKPTDNKITTSNSNLYAQNTNITNAKVILTKLENMKDNIYFINWKKKCAQQALLSKNLEPAILYEDVSINTLPTEIVDNSHKTVTEDSGNHMNKASKLNLSILQSKYKQRIIPKVLLVKLKNLSASCKEQNSFSTIKHSTAQCIDHFKLNLNHSSNVFDCNNKVNSDSSNIQSEENSSCTSEMSSTCSESIKDENLKIHKPLICEIEERPTLSETSQKSLSIERSIFTILQKCLERVSEKSTKEVVSDEMSERNSELKTIQTLPSFITKQNISPNTNNVTLKLTNEINCEDIQIPQNTEVTINDNVVITSHNDVFKKADGIIKLPENVRTEQQQMNIPELNIAASDNLIRSKCSSYKSLDNYENILDISKSNDAPESSLQQQSYALDSSSPESLTPSNISSLSTISKVKTEKHYHKNRDEDELSHYTIFSNDNDKSLQCNICSKLFDSVISLSNHCYSHIEEKQLKKIYKGNEKNQNSKYINVSCNKDKIIDVIDIIDLNEEIQKSNGESVNRPAVSSTIVESLQSSLKNAKDKSMTNKITSMKEMGFQKNISEENVLETLSTELNKNKSIKNSTVHEKISFKFCACHEKELEKETSIALVLFCNICNVLYQTIDCFRAHLDEKFYSCNGKKLCTKLSKLYCSICKTLLSDSNEMRKHMKNHLIYFKSIKLFCHICKVRFIGMGPIFFKHWSRHDIDGFYKASVSHFPAVSIVNAAREEWSAITSDEFEYLIITEHICSHCNVQCFSTNQLKNHMSSCKNKSLSKSKLDVLAEIDKISVSNKSSSEGHNFTCQICSDTFKNLKTLINHLKSYHISPVDFTCKQCKQSFDNFVKYIKHINNCSNTVDSINDSLYQHTNHQHNIIFKKNFPNLTEISNRPIEQIKQNNRITPINENISEVSKNQNFIVNQLIDSPTSSSSVKLKEIVSDDVFLSNQNITNQDLENLSSINDVKTANLNIAQINNFMGNSIPSVIEKKINKDKNACKVNNDSNKNGSKKHLNKRNTTVVFKSSNSKQNTVLDKNTLPSKTIIQNENYDKITLIEPEISRKDQENSWEAMEPTTNLQLNYTIQRSKESEKDKKYLRVRNILDLVEQPSIYNNMFIDQDESTSTSMSSSMAINLSNQKHTKKVKSCSLSSATALTLPLTKPTLPSTLPTLPSRLASTSITENTSVLPSASISVSVQETMQIPVQCKGNKSERTIPIEAPQSEQIPLPMQIVPYTESCSIQPKISNIQNSSIRSDEHGYSVNHISSATNNFRSYVEQQSQNITDNIILIVPQSSTNSITNNYENTTTVIQENNHEYSKAASTSTPSTFTASTFTASTSTASISTASTSTAINSWFKNYVSSNNCRSEKPDNTRNLLSVQNKVHNNWSDIVAEANSTDIRLQNRMELHNNNQFSNLPVPSHQYYQYNPAYATFLWNRNSPTMQTNHSKNNINLVNIIPSTRQQSNNNREVTTLYGRYSSISRFERLFNHLPPLQFLHICNYCSNNSRQFTKQEYDSHLNSEHNFICNLCNYRFYTLNDMENHKLNQHYVDFSNIFKS